MKTLTILFSFLLLIPACESGTDNTTDIPTEESSSSGSTTDDTNFRLVTFCRQESKNKTNCTATCFLDDLGIVDCTCRLPSTETKGSCTCCTSDGTCATGKYDDQICQ